MAAIRFAVLAWSLATIAVGVLPDANLEGADETDCGVASCAASSIMQKGKVQGLSVEALAENAENNSVRIETGSLAETLETLTELEEQSSNNTGLVNEAQHVHADLVSGGTNAVLNDKSGVADVVDLLNDVSTHVTSQQAAEDGVEITQDDLTTLNHGVNMEASNQNTFQGDMMPGNTSQLALFQQISAKHGSYAWAGTPWPNGYVKYCFAAGLPENAIKAFRISVAQFKKAIPCLTWKEVAHQSSSPKSCAENNAIYVQAEAGDGCWSYVGKTSFDPQELQIESPGCDSVGTTMHEIGHALGMAHEQSRPDRDTYVSVDLSNTVEDPQFKISPNADKNQAYDILSLMHYGSHDFATNSDKPVITVKPAGYAKYTTDSAEFHKYKIGSRIGLAQSDVNQLADMYNDVVSGGCTASILSSQTTCVDKLCGPGQTNCVEGSKWSDSYGDCDAYRSSSTDADPCSAYGAGTYCCGCGPGGWKVQSYSGVGSPPRRRRAPPRRRRAPTSTSTCEDSKTYTDPGFGDKCSGWIGYNCDGYHYSSTLKSKCPVACKTCAKPAAPW